MGCPHCVLALCSRGVQRGAIVQKVKGLESTGSGAWLEGLVCLPCRRLGGGMKGVSRDVWGSCTEGCSENPDGELWGQWEVKWRALVVVTAVQRRTGMQ